MCVKCRVCGLKLHSYEYDSTELLLLLTKGWSWPDCVSFRGLRFMDSLKSESTFRLSVVGPGSL